MDQAPLPDKVKRFIGLYIPSVPYIEALLIMRSEATKSWDNKELSQRLYLDDAATQTLLDNLLARGALAPDEPLASRYRYQPKTPELRQMIDWLCTCYAQDLIGVTNFIHSSMNKKAVSFANAFKWKKDK